MTVANDEELAQALNQVEILTESLIDIQNSFAAEDRGWSTPSRQLEGFNNTFRKERAASALAASVMDPLIKRATILRCAYIFAGGVQVSVRDDASTGQNVGAVVTQFWDDEDVQQTLSSVQALLAHERQNATHGEVFLALPTNQQTGRVRVRSVPPETIEDVLYDPEDAARPWFYKRVYTTPGGTAKTILHPALSYRPQSRPKAHEGVEVRWDAPMLHVAVNPVGGRGVGDLWAALRWARTYVGFLTDWAALMRALSKVATVLRTRGDRVQQAARHMQAATSMPGGGVSLTADDQLEALSTSGARFDADSGRPLAVMIAAALDLPVTTLLGDPGVTGARATAETVAEDSWAAFVVRQDLWKMVLRQIVDYVIDAAVIAPAGPLVGTIERDGDRLHAVLPEGDDRTVIVSFPERDGTAALDKVRAVVMASQTETVPELTIARLLLEALGVPDLDEVLKLITDDQGRFVPLDVGNQRVRDALADRGEG